MENTFTAGTVLEQPGFTLYWEDLKEYLDCFSDRELGHILRALYGAFFEEETPALRHAEELPFLHLKKNILAQERKYRDTKAQNTANGSKGGRKKAAAADRQEEEAAASDRCPTQTQTQTQNNTPSSSEEGSLPAPRREEAAAAPQGAKVCDARYSPYGTRTARYEAPPSPELRALFLQFRKAYPRKTGMAQAEPWFYEALKSVSPETMLKAISQQWRTYEWQKEHGRFIPSAEKWLRERCWEDEPAVFDDGYELL